MSKSTDTGEGLGIEVSLAREVRWHSHSFNTYQLSEPQDFRTDFESFALVINFSL